MVFHFIAADAEDFTDLTNLQLEVWRNKGFTKEVLAQLNEKLAITPQFIRNNLTTKILDINGKIIGFGALLKAENEEVMEISHFIVLPDFNSTPALKYFLKHLEEKAPRRTVIRVIADSDLLKFFQENGYKKVGDATMYPTGHILPVMKKTR